MNIVALYKYQPYVTIHFHYKPTKPNNMASSLSHVFLGVTDEVINKPEIGIPERFLRPDKQPSILLDQTNPSQTIPIFDFQTLLSADNSQLHNLFSACKDWGFFQVYINLRY